MARTFSRSSSWDDQRLAVFGSVAVVLTLVVIVAFHEINKALHPPQINCIAYVIDEDTNPNCRPY